MTTQNVYYFCKSLGEAWSVAAQGQLEPITLPVPGATYVPPDVGAYGGLLALTWSAVYLTGLTVNYFAVVFDMGAGDLIQADVFLSQSGASFFYVNNAGIGPLTDLSGLIETYWLGPKLAIVSTLCVGVTVTDTGVLIDSQTVDAMDIDRYAGTLVVQGAPGVVLTTDYLSNYAWTGAADTVLRRVDGQVVPDIADIDYDISINHGQSIFSVRGRTIAGS